MNSPVTPRILIVDDNRAIHEDFQKILGAGAPTDDALTETEAALFGVAPPRVPRMVFNLDSAFQGEEGLAMVEAALREGRPYALAFVDGRMPPGWDGVETISRLWNAAPELQVVLCTAYSDHSWDEITRRLGRSDGLVILKKPFDNVEAFQLAYALVRKAELGMQARLKMEDLERLVALRTQELQAANDQLRAEAAERRGAEELLRHSEQRFSRAFQASPVPMLIQELTSGVVVDANESFARLLDCPKETIVHRTAQQLRLWVDAPVAGTQFPVPLQDQRLRNQECRLRTASGAIRTVLLAAETVDIHGAQCLLVVAQDFTDRIELERQLRHSQKMDAVGQLAAGIAHDFNNLLTVIQGQVGLVLLRAENPQPTIEALKEVAMASERAAALTRQLLIFSRKHVPKPQVLDLNDSLRHATRLLRRVLGEQVELRLLCHGEPLLVNADECNLDQVIMNLAVNARDAMPSGGELSLLTSLETVPEQTTRLHPPALPGAYVCLTVNDTGCGMDHAMLGRIFEPFFTTKEAGKGTGLGLATVYGIVNEHHGWIDVVSQLGKGTTFRVFLPHASSPQVSSSQTEFVFRPSSTAGEQRTVLVVEDEAPLRLYARTVLASQGFRVLEAGDGVEALQVWATHRSQVDMLLTDMVMPNGISGKMLAD